MEAIESHVLWWWNLYSLILLHVGVSHWWGLLQEVERGRWILIDFLYCFIELKWYIRVLLNHGCFINFVLYLPETKYAGDDSVYIGVGRHSCLKADLIIR